MEAAILYLRDHGIESFELDGILVIPCSSPEEIVEVVSKVKKLLDEIGYRKSWEVDPYFYERRQTLQHTMFGERKETTHESNED